MKVVTPLSNIDSYEALVQAGADEFYCGYVPFEWLERYTNSMPLNRRELLFGYHNICDKASMKIISRAVQKYKVPVKITFNSHYYVKKQYPVLLNIIKDLIDMGFSTFIISDIAFIVYLREIGLQCDIHVSSEAEIYNSEAINVLNQLNISRYIFPRKVTANNIKNLIINSESKYIEYEAFILNAMCLYSGALCNGIHSDELPFICEIPFKSERYNKESEKFKRSNKILNKMVDMQNHMQQNKQNPQLEQGNFTYSLASSGCGLCRIKELMDIGVTHLKVIGRGCLLDSVIKDVEYTKKAIQLAKETTNTNDFIDRIKSEVFNNNCTYLCYYPSGITEK